MLAVRATPRFEIDERTLKTGEKCASDFFVPPGTFYSQVWRTKNGFDKLKRYRADHIQDRKKIYLEIAGLKSNMLLSPSTREFESASGHEMTQKHGTL